MTSEANSNVPNSNAGAGFIKKLSNGDFGLAKTYWLYGVVVGIAFRVLTTIIPSPVIVAILSVAWIAYAIFLYMGIWKAASKYTGEKIWAVLAQIMVVLGALFLLFTLVGLFTLLEGY